MLAYRLDPLPSLVVHADWGSNPHKRWMTRAVLGDGGYRVEAPEPVGDATTLVQRLRAEAVPDASILLGFDFPIGVPAAYAERAGIEDFVPFLLGLGQGEWTEFMEVAREAGDISTRRPFYPYAPGGKRQQHLVDGLGVRSMHDLLRRCDHAHDGFVSASSMFWTLGAKAVGKAAILGWKGVLMPPLRSGAVDVRLWPFHGALPQLVGRGRTVIVETYPAVFYGQLGVHFSVSRPGLRSGKTSQADRLMNAPTLQQWAETVGIILTPDLYEQLDSGFGPAPGGEDPFDATVGLFGMLNVALGYRSSGAPDDEQVQRVEGWMFGRPD
ncbi:MAG: hypothetical protein M3506_00590 [Chloroflexota bacterium]|nr:hypothetical protein [Chloroflexota bacterium]